MSASQEESGAFIFDERLVVSEELIGQQQGQEIAALEVGVLEFFSSLLDEDTDVVSESLHVGFHIRFLLTYEELIKDREAQSENLCVSDNH